MRSRASSLTACTARNRLIFFLGDMFLPAVSRPAFFSLTFSRLAFSR